MVLNKKIIEIIKNNKEGVSQTEFGSLRYELFYSVNKCSTLVEHTSLMPRRVMNSQASVGVGTLRG
jgi:hypothetical protein